MIPKRTCMMMFKLDPLLCRTSNELVTQALLRLGGNQPNALFFALAQRIKGRDRRHLARRREDVYPQRPDLLHHVHELGHGWYIGLNCSDLEKDRWLREACKLVQVPWNDPQHGLRVCWPRDLAPALRQTAQLQRGGDLHPSGP